MNAQLLGDLVARQIKRFEPDLSMVEVEDRRIPGKPLRYPCLEDTRGEKEE